MTDAPPPPLAPDAAPELALGPVALTEATSAEVWAVPVLPPAHGHGTDGTDEAGEAGEAGDGTVLLGPGADAAALALGLDLVGVAESARADGSAGEVTLVPVPPGAGDAPDVRLVVLLGVGDAGGEALRAAGAALARATRGRGTVASTVAQVSPDDDVLAAFVAGVVLASFSLRMTTGGAADRAADRDAAVRRVELVGRHDRRAVDRALALALAGRRSRWLATVPSNVKNPAWLADQAAAIADEAGLALKVWDEDDLRRDGFGGILGVGQGSATPPRLIRLDYRPAKRARRAPHVVLVGKGITFDSGGLSIKPAASMVTMKRDMSGGAVVMATMAALRALDCPVRVTGLVPAAENAVSGSSLRPGDVLRHHGGRTTEVTNTDAEGRLVLADALAYAVAELEPDAIVDVATLTGGVKVALGQHVGGLFATDDALADALSGAGDVVGEPLWRFPLHRGYDDKLSSKIADADNCPSGPAAIIAALFLRPFAQGDGALPWAHLDLASVGDAPKDRGVWTEGPTGYGARLLLQWLGSDDPLAGVG